MRTIQVPDKAANLIENLQMNNGQDALANLAVCWGEIYKYLDEEADRSVATMGVALMTELVKRLNDKDNLK